MTEKTLDQIKAEGYKLHHSAWFRGYVSRKIGSVVSSYDGKFGKGYTVSFNDGTSSQYSRVQYWVK